MKNRSFIRFLIACCFGLFAMNSNAAVNDETNSYSDPGKSILVERTIPQFSISLASNPTTGYSWHLLNYDRNLMMLTNHVYQAPTGNRPGAGGKETWTFQVNDEGFIAPQVGKITLLYARPWNLKDNSKQVEFTVVTR